MIRALPPARQRLRLTLGALMLAVVALAPGPSAVAVAEPVPVAAPQMEAPGYPWKWPVSGPPVVSEPFRAPAHEYGPGHRGMDVAAATGAVVAAPADGVVAFRGVVVDRPLITIEHGDGHVTTFEPVASDLAVGTPVAAGDPLGTVVAGGHSRAGTVHVGVRVDDAYVNPRPLFGVAARAVLLPCCGAIG